MLKWVIDVACRLLRVTKQSAFNLRSNTSRDDATYARQKWVSSLHFAALSTVNLRPSITQVSTTCHIWTSVVHRYYITFHEVLSWHNVLWIVQQKTSFPVSNSWSVNTLLWSLLCVGVYCGQIIAQHGLLSLSTLHECDCVMLREQIQRRRHLVLSTTHTTSGIQTTWQGHVIRPSRTPSRVSVTPSTCCISNAVLHEM